MFRWLEPQEEKEMESGGGGKTGQMETQADASPIIHLFYRCLLNTYYVPYNDQKTDMVSAPMHLTDQQNVKQSRAREPGRLQEKAKE